MISNKVIAGLVAILLFSCQDEKKSCVSIKNGKIIIECDNVNEIELIGKDSVRSQIIHLNTNSQIEEIKNRLNLNWKSKYINTWIKIDRNGSLIDNESYYYQSEFVKKDNADYLNLRIVNVFVPDGLYFVLTAKYDKFFLAKKSTLDTTYFNDDGIAEIKLDKYERDSIVRFIIVEKDTVIDEQRVTHGELSLKR